MQTGEIEFVGSVDGISGYSVVGWAADPTDYTKIIEVSLIVDEQYVTTTSADLPRRDLISGGVPNEKHGFKIELPPIVFDEKSHKLSVMVSNSTAVLGELDYKYLREITAEDLSISNRELKGRVTPQQTTTESRTLNVLVYEQEIILTESKVNLDSSFVIKMPDHICDDEIHQIELWLSYPRVCISEVPWRSSDMRPTVSLNKIQGPILTFTLSSPVEKCDLSITGRDNEREKIVTLTTNKEGTYLGRIPYQLCDGISREFTVTDATGKIKPTILDLCVTSIDHTDYIEELVRSSIKGKFNDVDGLSTAEFFDWAASDNQRLEIAALIFESRAFDFVFYRNQINTEASFIDLVLHYIDSRGNCSATPMRDFKSAEYVRLNPDIDFKDPTLAFIHYAIRGRKEKRYYCDKLLATHIGKIRIAGYAKKLLAGNRPAQFSAFSDEEYFLLHGWKTEPDYRVEGFSSNFYLKMYEDARESPDPPLVHFLEASDIRLRHERDLSSFVSVISASGEFDTAFYRSQLNENVSCEELSEVAHYKTSGEKLGLCPNRHFSPTYYRSKYADLAASNLNLFEHFLTSGRSEGRSGLFDASTFIQRTEKNFDPSLPTIVIVCHEASRSGAPILGLRLAEAFARHANVVSWIGKPGELTNLFTKTSVGIIHSFYDKADTALIVRELQTVYSIKYAIANSACTSATAEALHDENVPVVALIHEYGDYMQSQVVQMILSAQHAVFPAIGVRESAFRACDELIGQRPTNTHVRHQGRCIPPTNRKDKVFNKESIFERMGISRQESKPIIVLGCGWVQMRKGVEIFIEAARQLKSLTDQKIRFIWVGGGYLPDIDLGYSVWLRSQILHSDLVNEVFFFEETSSLDVFFEIADVFLLSSRLDPFPNVAIDAICSRVPVVAFREGSGFSEFIEKHPEVGHIADFIDAKDAAKKIILALTDKHKDSASFEKAVLDFSFRDYYEYVATLCERASSDLERINCESRRLGELGLVSLARSFKSVKESDREIAQAFRYVDSCFRGLVPLSSRLGFGDRIFNTEKFLGLPSRDLLISPLAIALQYKQPSQTHKVNFIEPRFAGLSNCAAANTLGIHFFVEDINDCDFVFDTYGASDRPGVSLVLSVKDGIEHHDIQKKLEEHSIAARIIQVPEYLTGLTSFFYTFPKSLSGFTYAAHVCRGNVFSLPVDESFKASPTKSLQPFRFLMGNSIHQIIDLFYSDPDIGLVFDESQQLAAEFDLSQSLKDLNLPLQQSQLVARVKLPAPLFFMVRNSALGHDSMHQLERHFASYRPSYQVREAFKALPKIIPLLIEGNGFHWETLRFVE